MAAYVIYILLVVISLLILSGFYFSRKVIYIPLRNMEKISEYESQNPSFDIEWYEKLDKEDVTIPSPFGYMISGTFIRNERSDGRTIIFCHGVTVSRICMVKYAAMYYRRGWNLFLYDHRRHGNSGGKTTTYGYFEKHDLKAVVDYVRGKIGSAIIGIHGESMGAATLLQYAGMEDKADFYIADCPYSSLWELLRYLLKRDYHLPAFPLMQIADIFIRLQAKFSVISVNPYDDVKNINKPVLFIHGEADDYVPTSMSIEMHKAKKGFAEIYIAPGAGHALSMRTDPETYENVVFSFMEKAGIS
ncbi:MAG: alpha/beta hydrolase [Clostridiaceae bacterium]|nr:alpha/beta hydrolase [Clostridiaceae bacterium]